MVKLNPPNQFGRRTPRRVSMDSSISKMHRTMEEHDFGFYASEIGSYLRGRNGNGNGEHFSGVLPGSSVTRPITNEYRKRGVHTID